MALTRFAKALSGAVLAVAVVIGGIGTARAETLTDALILAYRHSSLLEQNRALLRAEDEDVASAVARLRPVVDFVARAGITYRDFGSTSSGTIEITAGLTLFDFGRGELGIRAAMEAVRATRQSLVGVEQQVLLRAVAAYLDVRSAIEIVALRRNNVRLIERELQAARDRFEVGEITRTDVAIAEARLAGAESNLAAALGDLAVAREVYNAATGRYPGTLSAPPAVPRTATSLGAAQDIARRQHPVILEAQHAVTAAEIAAEIADLNRLGTVQLGASIGGTAVSGAGIDDTVGLSLTYRVPLSTGGAQSASYRRALALRDAARASLQRATIDVLQAVGESWANVAVARARLAASDGQIAAAETAYEGVREEASLGARTTLDVLNAEQELLDARATRITADAALYFASYQLLQSMGLLTVEHLNLGIPTYDPDVYYNAVRDAPVTSPQGARLDQLMRSLGRQ